jgi:hypothetical protein
MPIAKNLPSQHLDSVIKGDSSCLLIRQILAKIKVTALPTDYSGQPMIAERQAATALQRVAHHW